MCSSSPVRGSCIQSAQAARRPILHRPSPACGGLDLRRRSLSTSVAGTDSAEDKSSIGIETRSEKSESRAHRLARPGGVGAWPEMRLGRMRTESAGCIAGSCAKSPSSVSTAFCLLYSSWFLRVLRILVATLLSARSTLTSQELPLRLRSVQTTPAIPLMRPAIALMVAACLATTASAASCSATEQCPSDSPCCDEYGSW